MQKRHLLLLWPLLVAPILAWVTITLSGPAYTTAPNQNAMVIRFFGLLIWLVLAGIGLFVTKLLVKSLTKDEWIAFLSADLSSVLLFYLIISGLT